MQIKKIVSISAVSLSMLLLAGCADDEPQSENLNNQTDAKITENSSHTPVKAKAIETKDINVEHTIDFDGQKIPMIATYGIDKRYVNNWWFTNNEQIDLSIKPEKNIDNLDLGVNNVYADVSISSKYLRYNGVRQDSVNQSYSDLPNGFVSINKNNNFELPFQVESINENQTSFYMISGYGQTDTHRIDEGDLRARAYGAKLNVVWTLGIKKDGKTYFKTIHDTIGIPYERRHSDE